jgi:cellulose synthase/poly-beta-1,6-N-acetylglucosamine synthase-like glycosyltransferase
MLQPIADGITYLTAQSGESLLRLFWFVAIFEFPRYTLSFFSVAAILFYPKGEQEPFIGKVTVLIAGHNEEDSIERCVLALHEQSRPPDEIIVVGGGSADRMPRKLRDLQDAGLITEGHCTQLRSGKSAGVNLAASRATGDVIVNVDCDCTFDRHSLKHILEPLADPRVGAVVGNIVPRNTNSSLITEFQAIEYLISISQGKQASDLTGQVSCISGAFGAFRRHAFLGVGGLDAGGGEDLDLTLSLRKAGWRMAFAPDAICYTDVPEKLSVLVRQRFRWERDSIHLRYRKHRDLLDPLSPRFSGRELAHQADFLLFNVASAFVFPVYIVWLFATYGDLGLMILLGAQAGMFVLDGLSFVLAALVTPRINTVGLIPYVPGYSLFNGFFMRFVRLAAYMQEWLFSASYRDTYVPQKVHRARR